MFRFVAGYTPEQLFPRSPHLVDDLTGMAVWFTRPPGFVLQFQKPTHVDEHLARFIMGPLMEELRERDPDPTNGYIFVAEWSGLQSYDSDARQQLTRWVSGLRDELYRVMVVPPRYNLIGKLGIQVSATIARNFGVPFELAESGADAIQQCGLSPARDSTSQSVQ